MANLIEKGRLEEVNLVSGVITATIHEGFMTDRIVRIVLSDDQEFLNDLFIHLVGESGVGAQKNRITHIQGKEVTKHKITIIIE